MWSRNPGKDKDGGTRWVASDERDVQGSEKGQSKGNPAHSWPPTSSLFQNQVIRQTHSHGSW